jgi:hypothetical protein
MKRTITRLFDTRSQAESAIRELETLGLKHDALAIVARQTAAGEERSFAADRDHADRAGEAAEGAGKGAATGGILGGGAGLLAGLGLLAIPGLGPVVAAGWLASTVVGAAVGAGVGGATGGILGALKDAGVEEKDAHVYAEGVRRGGVLVSAKVDEADAPRVEAILDRYQGVDAATRGEAFRKEGWTRFDEKADTAALRAEDDRMGRA